MSTTTSSSFIVVQPPISFSKNLQVINTYQSEVYLIQLPQVDLRASFFLGANIMIGLNPPCHRHAFFPTTDYREPKYFSVNRSIIFLLMSFTLM